MNATVKLEKEHFPVLLNELNSIISPLYSGTFIDCTFGQGGHSKEILKNKKNKVIALDRDKKAIANAFKFEKKFKNNFIPRPSYWSGYRVKPLLIEFWQDMPFRLHDRLEYKRRGHSWKINRLNP